MKPYMYINKKFMCIQTGFDNAFVNIM